MRILTLTLKNFRSLQETILDLDRFNFVRGPNGCGKSSIQMALEYLFTGRCQMTDAAGRGAEALIRAGAKELEVSATLENGETICRRRTPRSHIVELNGKRVPTGAGETSLEKRFGSADVLSAVLNADRFLEMSETEQKRLLAQTVDAGKIGSFTQGLNRHLAAFGYTCSFALDPFQIRVSSTKDGHFDLSLKYLSESEQFRFGVAFQIALAIVTGIRFVVIDGADVFDKERRKMLTGLLLNSGLDQAIVLATSDEPTPSIVPQRVKFLNLAQRTNSREVFVPTAA